MIDAFETSVRINPNRVFFTFVDSSGQEVSFTYKQTRIISAALARRLKNQGVAPGDIVIAELTNSPEYIFLILASAYVGFALAALDVDLPEGNRVAQALTIERFGRHVAMHVDGQRLRGMLGRFEEIVSGMVDESTIIESISGTPRWERSIMGQKQDVLDDTVHFAEREAHLFDAGSMALIVFSGSSTSKSKAIPLTWSHLMQASVAANQALNDQGRQLWQERLPLNRNSVNFASADSGNSDCSWQCAYSLSHIRGFQTLVRSVVGRFPLRLYESFDAELVLKDRERSHVTHISVSDKMLQDMLTIEEWRIDIQPNATVRLAEYQCILIDDRALDPRTVDRAIDLGARVFAAYGIPETSGLIAESLITSDFRGGMRLMDGYDAHIVDADEDGFGQLAVKGPGVFEGYLNSSAAFTVDHYFITGNIAALYDGCIFIKNRATGMIIVDGEMVYPAEIADVLRHIPGVSEVHVFGISDALHGQIPVAVIERSDVSLTSEAIVQMSRQWLSDASMPKSVYIAESLPRRENGKLDRSTIEEMFHSSMKIRRITLHYVRIPFNSPVKAKFGEMTHRDSVIVELEDALGRKGLGECVAFDDRESKDFASGVHENLVQDVMYIRDVIAPNTVGRTFFHPRYTEEILSTLKDSELHPMAISAVECAMWDLYGHVSGRTLWELINDEYGRILDALVPEGFADVEMPRVAKIEGAVAKVGSDAVIDLNPTPVAMANSHNAVGAGYSRLKIRITPKRGFACVRSVRRAFPNLLITLDANQSFKASDLDQLRGYDALNIGWIEEPFSPSEARKVLRDLGDSGDSGEDAKREDVGYGVQNHFKVLGAIQNLMATPICVDDSYSNAQQASELLYSSDLHCISVKVAKFGGIEPTLSFLAHAKLLGKVVVMGGMQETGIGRRVSAAFETLPGIVFPGDIGSISRYFAIDVTYPRYEAYEGEITLNSDGFEYGLGCILDEEQLARVEMERVTVG